MKVPLIVKAIEDGLSIVYNGKRHLIPFPFMPYVWSREIFATQFPNKDGPYPCIDLWKKEPVDLYKINFDTPNEAYSFYKENRESQNVFSQFYPEQLMIEKPEFFLDYPNTDNLKVLFFDIEVLTDGTGIFPTPKNNPIIAIGCKFNGETKIFDNYSTTNQDEKILHSFFDYLKEIDPDIMVGYNIKLFDIPYIIRRSEKMNIVNLNNVPKLTYFTRTFTLPFIQKKRDGRSSIEFHGRVIFDIYDFVQKDQTLMGIKNHKMSTLADWYNIEYIDMDVENTQALLGSKELRKYLDNDVYVTEKLFNIYFPLQLDLAELMNVPLESVVNGPPSFIPKLLFGRNLLKKRMIPLNSNEDRYADHRFQAAIVELEKPGFFNKVIKIDMASYYPNIVRTFNLGSDTTQICAFLPYNPEYKIRKRGRYLWLSIPDTNFNKNLLIKIDMSKDGFLRKAMNELFDMRDEAKEKAKEDGPDKDLYETRSAAVKVLQNSLFGLSGLRHAYWGDMATAVAIAGLARWMMEFLKVKLDGSVVEIDTDGLFIDKECNVNELNNELRKHIQTHIEEPLESIRIELEREFSGPAYFYKPKNYALLKMIKGKETVIKHGTALKGSRLPKLYDKIMDNMARSILTEKDNDYLKEVMIGARDLNNFELKDFMLRTRIQKEKYANPNALQPSLARRAAEIFNTELNVGDALTYYKTTEGYKLSGEVINTTNLDKRYYSEIVEKVFYVFGRGELVEKERKKEAKKRAKEEAEAAQIKFNF